MRVLAGYRLFTTRDPESSRKSFFRFFRTQSFYVETKAKMLRLVRDGLERFEFCILNTG